MAYVKKVRKPAGHKALETWADLNEFIRTAAEKTCSTLLKLEQCHRNRTQYVQRIHSRLNRVRRAREREQLLKGTK